MLQSKSLQLEGGSRYLTLDNLYKLQSQAVNLSNTFTALCRNVDKLKRRELTGKVKDLESGLQNLMNRHNSWRFASYQIDLVIAELPGLRINSKGKGNDTLMSVSQRMFHLLHKIKIMVSRVGGNKNKEDLVNILQEYGEMFTNLIEALLTDIVKESLDVLGKCRTDACLRDSLCLISKLGLEGNHICRIFAREGGVSALVKLLGPTSTFPEQSGVVLRALGTICCVEESISDLQLCGGLDILAQTLRECQEPVQMEAAGVMAQITSPWIENCMDSTKLDEHAYDIVNSLTGLAHKTRSSETFLLCAAALANLSYQSPLFLTAMSQLDAVAPLLTFVYGRVRPSIYILDQVATILANLSASHHTRESLTRQDLVPALLLLLAADPSANPATTNNNPAIIPPTQPSNSTSLPILAATQRVQQKAAIAISRLSVYHNVCAAIVSGGGLERLVELAICRDARLDSDYTLVSVVTTVRKLAATVDIRVDLARLGAANLLESDLLDSLKLYSPLQESFV